MGARKVLCVLMAWTLGCRSLPTAESFGWPTDAPGALSDTEADVGVEDAETTAALDSADARDATGVEADPCGNSVCDPGEAPADCPEDCTGLFPHLAGPCTTPGFPDDCTAGYVCVQRTPGAGGSVCVADFATWPTLDVTRDAADFVGNGDTVTDTHTALMWTKKSLVNLNFKTAMAACPSQIWGGHSDWRLPTRAELRSLLDYTKSNPAMSAQELDWGQESDWYHTAVMAPGKNPLSVTVHWAAGSGQEDDVELPAQVRCVRGGRSSTSIPQRFVPGVGGTTMQDLATGLTWETHPPDAPVNWTTAKAQCEENLLNLPGTGWRLPTVREFDDLIQYRLGVCLPDGFAKGVSHEWTSTPYGADGHAWVVTAVSDTPGVWKTAVGEEWGVRCVR